MEVLKLYTINAIAQTEHGKRYSIGFSTIEKADDISKAVSELDHETAYYRPDGTFVRAAFFEVETGGEVIGRFMGEEVGE